MTINHVKKTMFWSTTGAVLFLLQSLFTVQANTVVLTNATLQQMTQEEIKAFNIEYQIKYKEHKDSYLALATMYNPYRKLIEFYESTINLSNKITNNLLAKAERFDKCSYKATAFIAFSGSAEAVTEGPHGMSKEKYMKSTSDEFDIDYPFTEEERNESLGRVAQVFVELVWKYRGKGEDNVFVFFNACMNIPIKIFEDEYEDEDNADEELNDEEN